MNRVQPAAKGSAEVGEGSGGEPPATALFAIVWDTLADVLGTAAAATIVRRAAARAAVTNPELVDIVILRENLDYRYRLPPAWSETAGGQPTALLDLVAEIGRLLVELTGTVVILRLEGIPELRAAGLIWRTEGTN